MKKLLIIGNDIHANRYNDVLLFRNDLIIESNVFDEDFNKFDYILFSEPHCFNDYWFNILKDYKKVLLLEKCQFRFDIIEKLKCNIYFIHLRDFDTNTNYFIKDKNIIVWPNLLKEKMSKIYHTLPNIFDFINNVLANFDIKINKVIKKENGIELELISNNKQFNIDIIDINEFGLLPKINDENIAWPNYFEDINTLFDKILNEELDFKKSLNKEKKVKLLIEKVEKEIMKLLDIKYTFNKNIIHKQSKDMLMAYNQENGDMYEFNEVGAEIFLLLTQEKEMKDIFNELTNKYNVTIEEIYDDVEEIVNRLIELKIILVD